MPIFQEKYYKGGTINKNPSCHEYDVTLMLGVQLDDNIIGISLIQQHKLKTCLKIFVDKGEKSFKKKLTQLHNMKTFKPTDSTKLTK